MGGGGDAVLTPSVHWEKIYFVIPVVSNKLFEHDLKIDLKENKCRVQTIFLDIRGYFEESVIVIKVRGHA